MRKCVALSGRSVGSSDPTTVGNALLIVHHEPLRERHVLAAHKPDLASANVGPEHPRDVFHVVERRVCAVQEFSAGRDREFDRSLHAAAPDNTLAGGGTLDDGCVAASYTPPFLMI